MRWNSALCLLTLAAGCGPTAPPSARKPADDPAARARAVEITEHMLRAYREASTYADHGAYVEQSVLRGEGVEHELPFFQMSLAFERPNRLRLTFEEAIAGSAGRRGFDIASDGKRMRTSSKEIADQIQESPAPEMLTEQNFIADPIVREALLERPLGDVFPQLAMLLSADENTPVFPRDSSPRTLADGELRGHKCYRIASSNPDGTRVLWIDQKNYALLRMELPVAAHRRSIDPDGNFINLRVWIDFEDASFGVGIDSKSFALEVPPDARRVTHFVPPPPPESVEPSADAQAKAREKFEQDLEAATIADSEE